jgi:glycosyltransferase involved in cell wall biosynthesis
MIRHLPKIGQVDAGHGRPYFNVGHTGLNDPKFRQWIDQAAVKPIYMVHDLIPITHPEYARPGEAERHEHRMATVLETAARIIFNSCATRESLADWGSSYQMPLPPNQVIWLGTKDLAVQSAPPYENRPYFVTLGTIEGRKNHLLLLNLWRDWAEHSKTPIPKLVIIGQRGWAAEQTFAMLDRCPRLKSHVVEHSKCDDEMLADLIAGARALLFPSFVEGYGMPLAEALLAGAPVIASDLPVFREIAGSIPIYCDALNGRAWEEAIRSFIPADSEIRSSQCAALKQYRAPSWAGHFQKLDRWLAEFGSI